MPQMPRIFRARLYFAAARISEHGAGLRNHPLLELRHMCSFFRYCLAICSMAAPGTVTHIAYRRDAALHAIHLWCLAFVFCKFSVYLLPALTSRLGISVLCISTVPGRVQIKGCRRRRQPLFPPSAALVPSIAGRPMIISPTLYLVANGDTPLTVTFLSCARFSLLQPLSRVFLLIIISRTHAWLGSLETDFFSFSLDPRIPLHRIPVCQSFA
jgi:hypothetical protein